MDKHIKRIIKELSEEYGISTLKVENIVMSEFHKMKEVITDEDYKSIQLMHLGKFQISEKRVDNYLKRKENED